MALLTNFKDDILDTEVNELRKYQMIENSDGTYSFVDVTTYSQEGSSYGAKEVNEERAAINELMEGSGSTTNLIYYGNFPDADHTGTYISFPAINFKNDTKYMIYVSADVSATSGGDAITPEIVIGRFSVYSDTIKGGTYQISNSSGTNSYSDVFFLDTGTFGISGLRYRVGTAQAVYNSYTFAVVEFGA